MKKIQFVRFIALISTIILIIRNPFYSCTNLDRPFYDKVLNDFDSCSYFIALNIKSSSFKGRTIIENNNLYRFLNKTRGFSKERYKSFMKRMLIHNKVLKINDKDFPVWNFIKVYESDNVLENANLGRDKFVEHYFNGVVMNYGLTEAERNAVVNQLFFWGYPVKFDKLSSNLIIG